MDPAGQDMNNRKLPHLSHRLQAIVDLLGDGTHYDVVADVGCDHGWVSITLIQKGIADKVIASDVRSGPLERAKEHVAQYELGDRIETVLSDGLSHIGLRDDMNSGIYVSGQKAESFVTAKSADAAVIAGMGGMLICDILDECAKRNALPGTLVLQPQLSWQEVRQCLRGLSYQITAEDMVKEDGKFYVLMRAERMQDNNGSDTGDKKTYRESELYENKESQEKIELADRFGPCLLAKKHPVLKEWLLLQQDNFKKIQSRVSKGHEDREGIEEKLHYLEAALKRFDL